MRTTLTRAGYGVRARTAGDAADRRGQADRRGGRRRRPRVIAVLALVVPVATLPAFGTAGPPALAAPSLPTRYNYIVSATIPVSSPGLLATDPATNTIYVDSGNSIAVVNGATNTVTITIPLYQPGPIVVNPATDMVYVIEGTATLVVIKGATNTVMTASALPDLPGPVTGVAVNAVTNMVYVSSSFWDESTQYGTGAVTVFSGSTNTVTRTISLPSLGPVPFADNGGGTADSVAVDSVTDTILLADDHDGAVLKVDGSTYAVSSTPNIFFDAWGWSFDPSIGNLYVNDFGALDVLSLRSGSYSYIDYPSMAIYLGLESTATDPGTQTVFVSSEGGSAGAVMILDIPDGAFVGSLPVNGAGPLTVNPATGVVYVDSAAGLSVVKRSIDAIIVVVSDQELPSGMIGVRYNGTLQASGGTAPYTWSIASGSLPAGLSLNPATGAITGTPVMPGTATFTVRVTDSANPANTAARQEAIAVGGCTSTITGTDPQSLSLNQGVACLTNATIEGPVTIKPGVTVAITGSKLLAGLTATSPAGLAICGSTVTGGPVSVTASTGYTLIGGSSDDGSPACAGNTISGGLTLAGTTGGAELGGNILSGAIGVTNNTGITPGPEHTGPEIENNTISGTLTCTGNSPAPVNDHQPIHGGTYTATGQCTGL